jgi:hypothetical protein
LLHPLHVGNVSSEFPTVVKIEQTINSIIFGTIRRSSEPDTPSPSSSLIEIEDKSDIEPHDNRSSKDLEIVVAAQQVIEEGLSALQQLDVDRTVAQFRHGMALLQ